MLTEKVLEEYNRTRAGIGLPSLRYRIAGAYAGFMLGQREDQAEDKRGIRYRNIDRRSFLYRVVLGFGGYALGQSIDQAISKNE